MKKTVPNSKPAEWASPVWRPLAGVIGIMVGSLVLAAVTALFGLASSMPWLGDTPENIALMTLCDEQSTRQGQQQCVRSLVAAAVARQAPQQLAASAVPELQTAAVR